MNLRLIGRRVLLSATTMFLVVVAWFTISGGIDQLPRAHTVGQQLETTVQFFCGVLSLLAAATSFRWRRFAAPVRIAWAASLAITAGGSSLVWGPPMPLVAALFGGVVLLLSFVVIRAIRFAVAG